MFWVGGLAFVQATTMRIIDRYIREGAPDQVTLKSEGKSFAIYIVFVALPRKVVRAYAAPRPPSQRP